MTPFLTKFNELIHLTQLHLLNNLQKQKTFYSSVANFPLFAKKPHFSLPQAFKPPQQSFFISSPDSKSAQRALTPPLVPTKLDLSEQKPNIHSLPSFPSKKIEEQKSVMPSLFDKKEYINFFTFHFPAIKIIDEPANDLIAKQNLKLDNLENINILIFSTRQEEIHHPFLKSLEKAISRLLKPCKIINIQEIEHKKEWKNFLSSFSDLKIILANPLDLKAFPQLLEHYLEIPKEESYFIQNIPLLPLSPIPLYIQKPDLKALLWRNLSNIFTLIQ